MNKAGILIHVVDDDAALRSALARLLGAAGFMVATYDCAASFQAAPPGDTPGCILLDMNMPGLSGLQLQQYLLEVHSPLPIVFLTGEGDIAMSVKAIKAGAEDFLSKPVASADLFDAIERAVLRYEQSARQQGDVRLLAQRVQSLTPREHEVFSLVIQGQLNKQIAYQLGNTERTVKEHRRSVMEKMQVDSLAELVLAATRLGLLQQR
jgi:FixJ family two-component response regulator